MTSTATLLFSEASRPSNPEHKHKESTFHLDSEKRNWTPQAMFYLRGAQGPFISDQRRKKDLAHRPPPERRSPSPQLLTFPEAAPVLTAPLQTHRKLEKKTELGAPARRQEASLCPAQVKYKDNCDCDVLLAFESTQTQWNLKGIPSALEEEVLDQGV
ncbi:hypothetical protein MC885_001485 [Smutsia gigantea]|nr:hypothetical protein MC885_001485 [Smutsia gigantea]